MGLGSRLPFPFGDQNTQFFSLIFNSIIISTIITLFLQSFFYFLFLIFIFYYGLAPIKC